MTVWFDRAFGLPFVRVRLASVATAQASGKVADPLARPIAGQRVMLISGGHKIITRTDDLGEYRFEGLPGGEALVFPVGKKPTDRPGSEESKKALVGLGEAKVPILHVTKLSE